MVDSTMLSSQTAFLDLSGRSQAKVFAVDDTVTPPQAGWVTVESLIAAAFGMGVSSSTMPPESILVFGDETTAVFGDGAAITFNS